MVQNMILQTERYDPAEGETIVAQNVSFEHFLKYFSEQHTEWLMGKVISVVTNNTRHQIIIGFLFNALSLFLGIKKLGRVLLAGVPMRIAEDRPAREPDLLVVLNEHRERIQPTYVDGPADLVVEIVSPESAERDREKKLREYEAAGVQEYWLIDPLLLDFSIYGLDEHGHYSRLPLDSQGQLVSRVLPGFALHPDLIWREEPPNGEELIALVQSMVK